MTHDEIKANKPEGANYYSINKQNIVEYYRHLSNGWKSKWFNGTWCCAPRIKFSKLKPI